MVNTRLNKRIARLFVALEGPVVTLSGLSITTMDTWTGNLYPALSAISRYGRYEIVLLDTVPQESVMEENLTATIAKILSHQGIAISHIVAPGSRELDLLLDTTDTEHSFVVAGESDVTDYAKAFNVNPLVFTNWQDLENFLLGSIGMTARKTAIQRNTKETKISLAVNIDGSGDSNIFTGLPFFDHMLQQIARHARFDIDLKCEGDLEVDEHHTVEDIAIVLGQAIGGALGDKRGISRYGFEILPMDECLAEVALDFSGRSWFVWNVMFTRDVVGTFPTELFSHFFKSFSDEAKCNLHMAVNSGNAHHQAEALFKAFARALRSAVFRYPGNNDLPSTKGVL